MSTHTWLTPPRRRLTVVVALAVALALAVSASVVWQVSTADDRRVDAACGTWIQQREQLRHVINESEEAAERAISNGTDIRDEFNDIDDIRDLIARWHAEGPALRRQLHGAPDASSGVGHEQNMAFFLGWVVDGVTALDDAIEGGDPDLVVEELAQTRGTLEVVSDTCLYAARA